MKLRNILKFAMFCVYFCLIWGTINSVFAQNTSTPTKEKPSNCEYMRHALDYSIIDARDNQNSKIILVFYLGQEESSKTLIARRVSNVEKFLQPYKTISEQFVMAEGKKRNGLGKIEIYIQGSLKWELFYSKNAKDCVE